MTIANKMIVVGYGYIGSRICGLISGRRSVQSTWDNIEIGQVDIAAVIEPDKAQADLAAQDYPNARIYSDIEEADFGFLQGDKAFIRDFAPLSERSRILQYAQKNRIDILLEKPLPQSFFDGPSSSDCPRVGVGMSEVNNPVVAELRRRVRDFSTVLSFRVARVNSVHDLRRSGAVKHRRGVEGGAFVDKMIHDLHLLEAGHYLGVRPDSFVVTGFNDAKFDPASGEDIYSDVNLDFIAAGHCIKVRLISSWIGLPPNISDQLGVSPEFVQQSVLQYEAETSNTPIENLKLAVVTGMDRAGDPLCVVANLQSRHAVKAGIWTVRNESVSFDAVRFNVPIIATTREFILGRYTTLGDVAASHLVAYSGSDQLARWR